MKPIRVLLWFLVIGVVHVSGQSRYAIEADPAAYLLNGYSVTLRMMPSSAPHALFSLNYTGSVDLPDALINLNHKNEDKGWHLSCEQCVGIALEHAREAAFEGFHFGVFVMLNSFHIRNDALPIEDDFMSLQCLVRAGWMWYPLQQKHVYVNPSLAIGPQKVIYGDHALVNQIYDVSFLEFLPTVRLGFVF